MAKVSVSRFSYFSPANTETMRILLPPESPLNFSEMPAIDALFSAKMRTLPAMEALFSMEPGIDSCQTGEKKGLSRLPAVWTSACFRRNSLSRRDPSSGVIRRLSTNWIISLLRLLSITPTYNIRSASFAVRSPNASLRSISFTSSSSS